MPNFLSDLISKKVISLIDSNIVSTTNYSVKAKYLSKAKSIKKLAISKKSDFAKFKANRDTGIDFLISKAQTDFFCLQKALPKY